MITPPYHKDCLVISMPYDAASRAAGAALGSAELASMFAENVPRVDLARECGRHLIYQLRHYICRCITQKCVPITCGGDHSISADIIRVFSDYIGAFNVVVFDAHHDCYEYDYLTHYSYIYHLKRELPINVKIVGRRYQNELAAVSIDELKEGLPTYISIDLDYFSPNIISNVGHAIVSEELLNAEAFAEKLTCIRNTSVVGVDIVEWYGSEESARERESARAIVAALQKFMFDD